MVEGIKARLEQLRCCSALVILEERRVLEEKASRGKRVQGVSDVLLWFDLAFLFPHLFCLEPSKNSDWFRDTFSEHFFPFQPFCFFSEKDLFALFGVSHPWEGSSFLIQVFGVFVPIGLLTYGSPPASPRVDPASLFVLRGGGVAFCCFPCCVRAVSLHRQTNT